MADGWTDIRQRSLINFLVIVQKEFHLSNLLMLLIFVQLLKNYVSCFVTLWNGLVHVMLYTCVGELETVQSLAILASKVTVFVYDHKVTLNWLRKRKEWREIIRPGATRFATTFIALQSLQAHKDDLQGLVLSAEFKKYSKVQRAKEVKQIVLDEKFWDNCLMIMKIMTPLIRLLRLCLLRLCDTDEKPSLAYIYEGMHRARLGIMNIFKNKKRLYTPYTDIIDRRWDLMLTKDLHATAYYLNPAFQYDQSSYCKKPEIMWGVLNVLDKVEGEEGLAILDELRIFREREKGFSRPKAIACCKSTRPDIGEHDLEEYQIEDGDGNRDRDGDGDEGEDDLDE
ncbi:PREDICTED: uncharacterized protein LOC105956485 [Erythranthe guttata]|uniref:uncharacterized protein LOC105956485 n=1 Tax=Erythranthe guttata TaxID=4155 RepID=UPI00064DAE23|nr:PREDICTED: uncharacterized protein LOC105956485 [Erythranthe guttata]|eukprot:XP_012835793.1 PREDICTED: uncharacterized protein LOC105956485 [Erythranthe guttata]